MRKSILLALVAVFAVFSVFSAAGLALGVLPAKASGFTEIPMNNHRTWCITTDYNHGTLINGQAVYLYQCYDNANQLWVQDVLPDGSSDLRSDLLNSSNQTMCIAPNGGGGADGTAFIMWPCNQQAYEGYDAQPVDGGFYLFLDLYANSTIADTGDILKNYNPLEVWHLVQHADYEEWF